jgi:hypothetical protein
LGRSGRRSRQEKDDAGGERRGGADAEGPGGRLEGDGASAEIDAAGRAEVVGVALVAGVGDVDPGRHAEGRGGDPARDATSEESPPRESLWVGREILRARSDGPPILLGGGWIGWLGGKGLEVESDGEVLAFGELEGAGPRVVSGGFGAEGEWAGVDAEALAEGGYREGDVAASEGEPVGGVGEVDAEVGDAGLEGSGFAVDGLAEGFGAGGRDGGEEEELSGLLVGVPGGGDAAAAGVAAGDPDGGGGGGIEGLAAVELGAGAVPSFGGGEVDGLFEERLGGDGVGSGRVGEGGAHGG